MSKPNDVDRYIESHVKDHYGASVPGIQRLVEGASVPQLRSVLVERGASVPPIQPIVQISQKPTEQISPTPSCNANGEKS